MTMRIAASDLCEMEVSTTSADLSLGIIPPKTERVKDSEGQKIFKLCGDTDWQPRFLIVTLDKLIITHPGQSEISDQIPLVCYCD